MPKRLRSRPSRILRRRQSGVSRFKTSAGQGGPAGGGGTVSRKISPVIRKAFRMAVGPGGESEYERRHRPIWPELEAALLDHGVRTYSIFLDTATNDLFGYAEIDCEAAMGRHRVDRRLPAMVEPHARPHAHQPGRQSGLARFARGLPYRCPLVAVAAARRRRSRRRQRPGPGRRLLADQVDFEEAHRFAYAPRQRGGHLRWDFDRLLAGMRDGLRQAAPIASRGSTAARVGRRRFVGRRLWAHRR